jgi:hypothetical protein
MGRWAQRQRYGRTVPITLPALPVTSVTLGPNGSGRVDVNWAFGVTPDNEVFYLIKNSDSSILAAHTETPALISGFFAFSGITSGILVHVRYTADKVGYAPVDANTNTVTVP